MPERHPVRTERRDSRRALIVAARQLFADVGYHQATMRAVAARAGVDPALAYHYFDGKQGLLEAALAPPAAAAQLTEAVSCPPEQAGEALVQRLLHVWDADEGLREQAKAILRIGFAGEGIAADRLREMQTGFTLSLLGDVMAPDQPELRAALIRSHLTGLFVGRYLLKLPGLTSATHEILIATEGQVIQRYLTGPLQVSGAEDTAPAGVRSRR